jgi:hypothetical protein
LKYLLAIAVSILISFCCIAQDRINPHALTGTCESTDSTKNKIEFRFHERTFFLTKNSSTSIVNQPDGFEFAKIDSTEMVRNYGVIYKWPPDYCYVRQIDEMNIEIKYDYFGTTLNVVYYRKL